MAELWRIWRKLSGIEAYAIAREGHGFTVGAVMAANTVYVFFDTHLPALRRAVDLPRSQLLNWLKMVWMPIGLLRPGQSACRAPPSWPRPTPPRR